MKAEFKKGLLKGEIVTFNHYRLPQNKIKEQGQRLIFIKIRNLFEVICLCNLKLLYLPHFLIE